jgi:Tol biopolymer transport system component
MSLIVMARGVESVNQPKWLPDGKSIAYKRSTNEVVVRDLATDAVRTIVNPGSFVGAYALSPDGGSVTFITPRDKAGAKGDIHVTTLGDGRTRTLVEYQNHPIMPGSCCDAPIWSPDGRYIIYSDRTADAFVAGTTKKRAELWRIPAAGGPAEKLGLTLDSIAAPAISPDGRRLAFEQSADRAGLWVLKNFLPASELRRGAGRRGQQ